MDGDCSMCQNTPHRRCVGNFAAKYLSGDPVKAKCGATIYVEAIDQATGRPAGQDALDGLHLEASDLTTRALCSAVGRIMTRSKTRSLEA